MAWCVVKRSSDQTIGTSDTTASWDSAEQSGGTFWSGGSPTRITIGATETEATFFVNVSFVNADTTRDVRVELWKNGGILTPFPQTFMEQPTYGDGLAFVRSPYADTDYFEVHFTGFGGTRSMEGDYSAFSMATPERVGIVTAECTSYDDSTGLLTWGAVVQSGYYLEQGSEVFTVPAGVGAIIVSLSADGNGSAALHWDLLLNGSAVRRHQGPVNPSADGPPSCFGVVAVDEGDEIEIFLGTGGAGSATVTDIVQARTRLTIELLE